MLLEGRRLETLHIREGSIARTIVSRLHRAQDGVQRSAKVSNGLRAQRRNRIGQNSNHGAGRAGENPASLRCYREFPRAQVGPAFLAPHKAESDKLLNKVARRGLSFEHRMGKC